MTPIQGIPRKPQAGAAPHPRISHAQREGSGDRSRALAEHLPQSLSAHAERAHRPPVAALCLHLRPGPDPHRLLRSADHHRNPADGVLQARRGTGLQLGEGHSLRSPGGPVHPQHPPLERAPDGAGGVPAHGARLLHRLVQTPAGIQLAHRPGAAGVHAGSKFHRLSAAVGPTGVLGDHHRRQYRQLAARGDRRASASPPGSIPAAFRSNCYWAPTMWGRSR